MYLRPLFIYILTKRRIVVEIKMLCVSVSVSLPPDHVLQRHRGWPLSLLSPCRYSPLRHLYSHLLSGCNTHTPTNQNIQWVHLLLVEFYDHFLYCYPLSGCDGSPEPQAFILEVPVAVDPGQVCHGLSELGL